jgi:hypothetical protein
MRRQRSEERGQRSEVRGQGPEVVCLTKTQMAAALQISVRSLNGMMARREISFFKIGTKLVRFRVEDALKRMSETVLVTAEEGEQ